MINPKNQNPTISILGCGWYGLALAKELIKLGYAVKGSTTSNEKLAVLAAVGIEPYLVDFELSQHLFDPVFFESEVLIISIPPKKSSPSLADYPAKIEAILAAAATGTIKHLIFISSTGVYADGNAMIDENVTPEPTSDSGKMMYAAEELLKNKYPFTTTIIRFGGLIGPDRNLAKHFAGKTEISNGLAVVNLIHLSDCIGLTHAIIAKKAYGNTYHGVSPDHPTRASFYTKNCIVNGFPKPHFKQELLATKQIDSINVPKFLNYIYQVSNWDDWLNQLAVDS